MVALMELVLLPWVFWPLLVLYFVGTLALIECRRYFWPLVIAIAFIVFHDWCLPGETVRGWMREHLTEILIGVVTYIPLGCICSILWWRHFCRQARRKYDLYLVADAQRDYDQANRSEVNWRDRFEGTFAEYREKVVKPKYMPNMSTHADIRLAWIAYWPLKGFWFLTHDTLRDLFQTVAEWLSGIYQRIRDDAFRD